MQVRRIVITFIIILFYRLGYSQDAVAFLDYIGVYQGFISDIRGANCSMYPSCSNYGISAFRNYNPPKAFAVISDRLFRCGHDVGFYSPICIADDYRLLDTIEKEHFKKETIDKVNIELTNEPDKEEYGKSKDYLNFLIINKEYDLALAEIYKCLFNKREISVYLYEDYVICLKAKNQQNKIIYDYQTVFPDSIRNNLLIKFEMGKIYLDLKNYKLADSIFNITSSTNDKFLSDKSKLLSGFCKANLLDFRNAKADFLSIDSTSVFSRYANQNIILIDEMRKFKPKSSTIAGFLGIIPGLGYLYSGHKQSAITSLVFNSIMFYATYSSFKTKNYGLGILTGVFSISFYSGNIYGGIKSTHRYNRSKYDNLYKQIKLIY